MTKVYVKPPAEAQKLARKALTLRRRLPSSKRGGFTPTRAGEHGIGSGIKRAEDIAKGRRVDAMQVHRFFSRWAKKIEDEIDKHKGYDESKILQDSGYWGGFLMWEAAREALEHAGLLKPSHTLSSFPSHVLEALHEHDLAAAAAGLARTRKS